MAQGAGAGGRPDAPIGLGVAGLGMAGAVMVRAAASHPGIKLLLLPIRMTPRETPSRATSTREPLRTSGKFARIPRSK